MKTSILLFLSCIALSAGAQTDSTALPLGMALQVVREYHPVARQARLMPLEGEAYLRYARGAFDPKVYLDQKNKYFNGKNYYDNTSAGIKIPTWFGAELSAGWEQNRGVYVNPEDATPAGGLSYAGASLPLMRNLITDNRRTQLAKARLMKERSLQGRDVTLNELAGDVLRDYISWYTASREMELYSQAVTLTSFRLQAIRAEYLAGSKPANDTIETAAQLSMFSAMYQEAEMNAMKSRLAFSAHMWSESGLPMDLQPLVQPTVQGLDFLDSMLASFPDTAVLEGLSERQPELVAMDLYIRELELEKKLRQQQLLPDLNVKYQMLGNQVFNYSSLPGGPLNNYSFGLNFNSSLFLRKERGEFQLSKYKWQGASFKFQQKNRETALKVQALYQQVQYCRQIIQGYDAAIQGFNALYNNELLRFEAGDATVFMVNTRENKLLESRIKQVSNLKKLMLSQTDYLEKAGVLWQLLR